MAKILGVCEVNFLTAFLQQQNTHKSKNHETDEPLLFLLVLGGWLIEIFSKIKNIQL